MESFSRLGLAEPLSEALASFGFATPTAVQAETIPAILSRRDLIIESETGTGKTFAYLAPAFQLVSTLERKGSAEPGAIIAAPTQELAVQIGRESERLAKAAGLPIKTVVLLGGSAMEKQAAKLKAKPEIVVGTLGRLADLVALGKLRTNSLKILVLDEADRLFARETEELARALIKSAPSSCVRALVSATIPEKARREMRPLLRDALEICPVGDAVMSGSIEHWCFYCDGRKRLDFARRFEAAEKPSRCLMFLTMATRVEKAAQALEHLGLPIEAIHSGMDKETRRVALERFSSGEVRYLLTSDLGARGLDIPGISHVLSLDLPDEPTIYTHRAGRTGRAGATGVSIVLADGVELARASKIATKGGFVFRCKVLEEGKVLEPTSEEFFARAAAAEDQRSAAKAAKIGEDEHKGGSKRRPGESRFAGASPRSTGAARFTGDARRTPDPRRSSSGERRARPGSDDETRKPPRRDDDRARRVPEDDTPEAPRTAKKPASAPWRPASDGEAAKPRSAIHKLLHKKADVDKEAREAAPSKAAPRREDTRDSAPRGSRPAASGARGGAERSPAARGPAHRGPVSRGSFPRANQPRGDSTRGAKTPGPKRPPQA